MGSLMSGMPLAAGLAAVEGAALPGKEPVAELPGAALPADAPGAGLPAAAPALPFVPGAEGGRVGGEGCAAAHVLRLAQKQIRQAFRDRIARIDSVQSQTCKDKARRASPEVS